MNGANSNTSGANVANVGFWPSGMIPKIISSLSDLSALFKKVVAGEANIAQADFVSKGLSDTISDNKMAEIARRLVVTFEQQSQGNVVFSPTEPEDRTKAWWQTDPQTGIPIGEPKIWDAEANRWVSISEVANYVPPLERFGEIYAAPGTSTANLDFADIKTDKYDVVVTPTTKFEGAFLPFPGNFPRDFGWVVVNKTNTQVSLAFDGVPNLGTELNPKGLTFEITVRERKS